MLLFRFTLSKKFTLGKNTLWNSIEYWIYANSPIVTLLLCNFTVSFYVYIDLPVAVTFEILLLNKYLFIGIILKWWTVF